MSPVTEDACDISPIIAGYGKGRGGGPSWIERTMHINCMANLPKCATSAATTVYLICIIRKVKFSSLRHVTWLPTP